MRLSARLPLSCRLSPRLAIYPVGNCHYNRRDETTNRENYTNAGIDPAFNPRPIGRMIESRDEQAIGQIREAAENPANGKCLEALQFSWLHDFQQCTSVALTLDTQPTWLAYRKLRTAA
jgi:hypothetical protein